MSNVRQQPRFRVGQRVWNGSYSFVVKEIRKVRGRSGYPKYEYLEIWTWHKEKDLAAVK